MLRKTTTPKNMLKEENEDLRNAFDLFDTMGTGRIVPLELMNAMDSLGLREKNPVIYKVISDLNTREAANKGGITYDTFCDAVNYKLGDKTTKEGIKRIYDLFIDDPDTNTITINSISRVSKELGRDLDTKQLNEILMKASSNGSEITFEEFYDMIISK